MQLLLKFGTYSLVGFLFNLVAALAAYAQADLPQPNSDEVPDRDMLEFLAEYGDIDDEGFNLLLFHGRQDVDSEAEVHAGSGKLESLTATEKE